MIKLSRTWLILIGFFLLTSLSYIYLFSSSIYEDSTLKTNINNVTGKSFRESFSPRYPKGVITVKNSVNLDPSIVISKDSNKSNIQKEWSFFILFKPRKLKQLLVNYSKNKVTNTTREVLAVKYDRYDQGFKGWAVAYKIKDQQIVPEIYWKGDKGGGWNTYEEIPWIKTGKTVNQQQLAKYRNKWILFVLSYTKKRFLSLDSYICSNFTKNIDDSVSVNLIHYFNGALEVTDYGKVNSDADLLVGSPYDSKFRGNIAMVAVLEGSELRKKFDTIVPELFAYSDKNNYKLPILGDVTIPFITYDGIHDLGQENHQITKDRIRFKSIVER
jgi:hypothetical protein